MHNLEYYQDFPGAKLEEAHLWVLFGWAFTSWGEAQTRDLGPSSSGPTIHLKSHMGPVQCIVQEWWSNSQLLGLTKSIWVVSSNWWGRSPILCRSPLRTFLEPTIFGWTLYFTVVATGERWRASEGLLLASISSPQWRKRLFPYAFKLGNRFWLLYAYILNSSSEYPLFLKSLGQMLESTPTGPFFLLLGEFNAHMSDDSVTWRGMNGRKWSEPILH